MTIGAKDMAGGEADSQEAILAALGRPGLICDGEGQIQLANRQAAWLHRCRPEDLTGRKLTDIGAPRSGYRFLTDDGSVSQILAHIEVGSELSYQAWHEREGHGRFPASITLRPIRRSGQSAVQVLATLRDEQAADGQAARMRLALDDAESIGRLKSEVLSRAGHDLRTPLTAIMGFCDLLLLDHPEHSEVGSVLARMRRSGAELDRQFARLIDFFKLLDGVLPIDIVEVSPADVVRRACQRWRPVVANAGLDFRQAIDDSVDRVHVAGDPRRMASILDELVCNAVAASREGTIEIGAQRRGDEVVFLVSDQGSGFPFYGPQGLRAPPGAGEAGEGRSGLGIGLPMARRLAAAQGGTLRMAESGTGGSRVELILPIYPGR